MLKFLGLLLLLSLLINLIMFIFAYRLRSDKLTDVSYAISFMVLAIASYAVSDTSLYNLIGLIMIIFWSVRIGGFLLYRVIQKGKDGRFDGIREDFFKFGKFWLGQAFTAWILMIPFMLASYYGGSLGAISVVGVIVWLVGFIIESIADYQKYLFGQEESNKNKWIESGIWKFSRHPNYFGEILVWIGLYLYALPNLGPVGIVAGLLSPLLIVTLLLFITGIPILEKAADSRWGKSSDYKEYKRRTSLLIILPRR